VLLKRQPGSEPPLVGAGAPPDPDDDDRLGLALDLLQDPALDTLVTGISHFNESPEVLQRLASGDLPALCHVVT
jgi:hypothetical protein